LMGGAIDTFHPMGLCFIPQKLNNIKALMGSSRLLARLREPG